MIAMVVSILALYMELAVHLTSVSNSLLGCFTSLKRVEQKERREVPSRYINNSVVKWKGHL